ncbi:MAG: hypothetical protein ABSF69_07980 [Polyangiaceae bacterium]|jgi:hypothetical protein
MKIQGSVALVTGSNRDLSLASLGSFPALGGYSASKAASHSITSL